MAGIKETTELIEGLSALAHVVIALVKDGVQVSDAKELFSKALEDGELNKKLIAAIEGVAQVPVEVADVDFFEGLKLGKLVLSEVKK